jgi:hypothetical protein
MHFDATHVQRHQAASNWALGIAMRSRYKGKKSKIEARNMDWYLVVFEMIDMRSFSNLWFWIVLAVIWSSTSHWVIGVPYDMVERARRHDGQARVDLENLVAIYANRILFIVQEAGAIVVALTSAFLTALAMIGFIYAVEFAQALFLLLFPLSLVGALSVATAHRIKKGESSGKALWRRLKLHRIYTQMIGIFSIFVTSFWGIAQNASAY